MIADRNYSAQFPFTGRQWQELEQQVLTFRYLMSGLPVPPGLMSTVFTTPSKPSPSSLFPHLQHQQPLPFGLGCFQVGYGRKIDKEPGRCKRTDGKKWRCSKEAHPDSKYCERHMHRSKAKAKKQFDVFHNNSATKSSTNHTTSSFSPYPSISSCSAPLSQNNSYANKIQTSSFYPFMSAQSSSLSDVRLSTQENDAGPHWLDLDGEFHAHPAKEIRHCNEMKGIEGARMLDLEASKRRHEIREEERSVGVSKEHDESQKMFHHFLGDWPVALKNSKSHAVGAFSTDDNNNRTLFP